MAKNNLSHVLQKTQLERIDACIRGAGFTHDNFFWLHDSDNQCRIDTLGYKDNPYYFSFKWNRVRDRWEVKGRPGEGTPDFSLSEIPSVRVLRGAHNVSFETVIQLFRSWLDTIKREIAAVNPWEVYAVEDAAEQQIIAKAVDENSPFTDEECDLFEKEINTIWEWIRQHTDLDETRDKILNDKMDYVIAICKSQKFNRKDVMVYLLGVLTQVVFMFLQDPQRAKELFQLAMMAFSGILPPFGFEHLLYPASPPGLLE